MENTNEFKAPEFTIEEEVFNYRLNRAGKVFRTARDQSKRVQVLMDGNQVPVYYWKSDFYPDYKAREAQPNSNLDTSKLETDPEWAAKLGSPIKHPEHTSDKGEHIKSYLINYVTKDGKFHVEKIAAKGIVTAITIFYFTHAEQERAIVSVICVL